MEPPAAPSTVTYGDSGAAAEGSTVRTDGFGSRNGADPPTALPVDPAHAPARSGNNAVNALLAQADGARRGGDLDGAIATAERALRIAPADPAVYYELAVLRLARGERAVAEQLARKGLNHQPDMELRERLEELLRSLSSG